MEDGKKFLDAVLEHVKMFYPSANRTVTANEADCSWLLDPLARWTEKAYGEQAFRDAAQGYAEYCVNVAKAQRAYEETGVFAKYKDSQSVKDEVYDQDGYMVPYMWAAILIYPFWPSVVNHINTFRTQFVEQLAPNSNVLELACGHGVLGLLNAEYRKDTTVTGYDISPAAIKIAERLSAATGFGDRSRFITKDILEFDARTQAGEFQGVIAAMLAEHLHEPERLFASIKQSLAEDGITYFSTALESAQEDHVYEFNHESEPIKMAEEAGLRVKSLICDSIGRSPGQKYNPRSLAMILVHQ